jgi:hypothetical protein
MLFGVNGIFGFLSSREYGTCLTFVNAFQTCEDA